MFSADDAFKRKNEEIEMVATSATINIDGDEKSVTGASIVVVIYESHLLAKINCVIYVRQLLASLMSVASERNL